MRSGYNNFSNLGIMVGIFGNRKVENISTTTITMGADQIVIILYFKGGGGGDYESIPLV